MLKIERHLDVPVGPERMTTEKQDLIAILPPSLVIPYRSLCKRMMRMGMEMDSGSTVRKRKPQSLIQVYSNERGSRRVFKGESRSWVM
jgi:hypothetical protein